MNEEQENGVAFSEIVRIVWKKIWIVLLASVLTAVLAVLVVGLAVNPMRTTYSMDFVIVFPKSETEKYPDGSPFSYYSIASADFLNEAKASSDAFSSVDIEKMTKKEDIAITVTKEKETAAIYTLTVKGSYFSDKSTAEQFLQAAADVAVARIRSNAAGVDYGLKEEIFKSASYGKKLQLLTDWKKTMKGAYETWIEEYSATYTVNGKTLQNYQSMLDTVYDEDTQKGLLEALENCGYDQLDVSSYESLAKAIAARTDALTREKRVNEAIIAELSAYLQKLESGENEPQGGGTQTNSAVQFAATVPKEDEKEPGSTNITIEASDAMTVSQMIAFYIRRNNMIDSQIDYFLDETIIGKFVSRIEAQYEDLSGAAKTLSSVTASIYDRETSPNFTSQKAQVNNHLSIILMAAVGFVAAFFVSAVVVYAVCHAKKRQQAAPAVGQAGAETEAGTESGAETPSPSFFGKITFSSCIFL